MEGGERYYFVTEWFDQTIKVKRHFILTFFTDDGSVEMYDTVIKKLFLKRIKTPLSLSEMYVGNTICVLGRQLSIVGFADERTKLKCGRNFQDTLCLVKAHAFGELGRIIDVLQKNKLIISRGRLAKAEVKEYAASSFAPDINEKFVVFELRGDNAVDGWKKLRGEAHLGNSAEFCLGPNTEVEAKREIDIYFPSERLLHCNTALLNRSTCCLILPHIVRDGKAGKVLQHILDFGYNFTALEFVTFEPHTAKEFLEVYKGILTHYNDMVTELTAGLCLALEIVKFNTEDVVAEFRQLAGPLCPELAKQIRPNTLRAIYGKDKVRNAVHCTDLSDDGRLEVEYVFRILPLPEEDGS